MINSLRQFYYIVWQIFSFLQFKKNQLLFSTLDFVNLGESTNCKVEVTGDSRNFFRLCGQNLNNQLTRGRRREWTLIKF
jgi:hypothetical protein